MVTAVAEPEAIPEVTTDIDPALVAEMSTPPVEAEEEAVAEPVHHHEDPEEHARRILHEVDRPPLERIQDAVTVLSAHALSIEDGPYIDMTYAAANYSAAVNYQMVIADELRRAARAAGQPTAALA